MEKCCVWRARQQKSRFLLRVATHSLFLSLPRVATHSRILSLPKWLLLASIFRLLYFPVKSGYFLHYFLAFYSFLPRVALLALFFSLL
jgi:hypothetical protein